MKQLNKIITRVGVAATGLLAPVAALAVNPFTKGITDVQNAGQPAGINPNASLTTIVGNIINIALGFLGILLLAYLLYAGFLWMTAGGDEGQVKKAKETIQRAIIGLVIIAAAFAISNFVLQALVTVSS
jgi:amino acid transporter